MLIWLTTLVWAEDGEKTEDKASEGTIVVEDSLPQTSASSTIEIDDAVSDSASLAEILQRQSSVIVRDMGGVGTTATISIRGTSTRQSLMLLNGVPLNPDGNSTVNLQDIPAHMLERMTLYRSHSPLHLMSSTIGGVLDMKTISEATSSLHVGLDSWTNSWVRGNTPFTLGESQGNIFVSGLFANNAYPYFDNRNTPFNTDDDVWATRQNNDVQQGNFLGTWDIGSWSLVHTGARKIQGIPGHIIIPTPDIRMHSNRHLTGLHRDWGSETRHHDLQLWHTQHREILQDPKGNLGQGELEIDWTYHSIGVQGIHRWTQSELWYPSVGWSSRMDFAGERQTETGHQRFSQQIQFGQEFILDQWEWSSRLNTHWLSTQSTQVVVAPKTSFLYHISDRDHTWISLLRGFRPPDFTEVYGNRGAIIGNPNLLPEVGTTLDLGWTRQQPLHWLRHLQMAIFARDTNNEILFVQNAQRQSLPINFEATRVLGLESEWQVQLQEHLEWAGSLSLTHSENRSNLQGLTGKNLPNIPQWSSSQQLWWMSDKLWLGSDVYWADGNYWDAPNQRKAPTRLIHNATFRYTSPNWRIEITGRNLWNRIVVDTPIDPLNPELGLHPEAVQDFLGYPLMGRSVALSITWGPVN